MNQDRLRTAVMQSMGEASMCWIPDTGNAVFDSTHAQLVGERLIDEINSLCVDDQR